MLHGIVLSYSATSSPLLSALSLHVPASNHPYISYCASNPGALVAIQ
jgi:hypothetical protein